MGQNGDPLGWTEFDIIFDLGDRYAGTLYDPGWLAERGLDRPPAPVARHDVPVSAGTFTDAV